MQKFRCITAQFLWLICPRIKKINIQLHHTFTIKWWALLSRQPLNVTTPLYIFHFAPTSSTTLPHPQKEKKEKKSFKKTVLGRINYSNSFDLSLWSFHKLRRSIFQPVRGEIYANVISRNNSEKNLLTSTLQRTLQQPSVNKYIRRPLWIISTAILILGQVTNF